jgi:hypothetical protein
MLVWPFILLTIGLTAVIGYAITQIEKDKIMADWTNRRCDVPIMTMARYFKSPDDPRSATKFAQDNFVFCMDQFAKRATAIAMKPVQTVMESQFSVSSMITEVLNTVRKILRVIYDQFLSYMAEYMVKYQAVANQIRNVTLHLRAAFERVNATLLSTAFMGITMVRGILNSVDFVIKVVMIIMGIMIALIILLFFILFPFLPLIFSVIGAIMAVAIGSVAAEASSFRSGFCFSPNTRIAMLDGTHRPISQLEINDILANKARVEGILQFSGRDVPLWMIDGVYVSGSHLVESSAKPGTWHPVAEDSRAIRTAYTDGYIYCLNTTTHCIPVVTNTGAILRFRDWEELEDADVRGHYEWNFRVMQELNKTAIHTTWSNAIGAEMPYPAVSPNTYVATPNGNREIASIRVGDTVYSDITSHEPTTVVGVCKIQTIAEVSGGLWETSMIVYDSESGIWKRTHLTKDGEHQRVDGIHLVTESGTFVAYTSIGNVVTYRDYTEVGYDRIEAVNKCVEVRLAPI